MRYWLMKTEPETFSFETLEKSPRQTASWDGVRNYQARNFMRDEMKKGDLAFIYHSSTKEPAIIGIAEVVREAHPDLTALDPKSQYFDEKSTKDGASRWCMVDVKAVKRFKVPFTLAQARETRGLEKMALIKPGQRLSIQPVTKSEWDIITGLAGIEKIR
jgi:predicted RNA-binding protein with PUA-like domain